MDDTNGPAEDTYLEAFDRLCVSNDQHLVNVTNGDSDAAAPAAGASELVMVTNTITKHFMSGVGYGPNLQRARDNDAGLTYL